MLEVEAKLVEQETAQLDTLFSLAMFLRTGSKDFIQASLDDRNDFIHACYPWLPKTDRETDKKKAYSAGEQAWIDRFGDPDDEETQRKIEATIAFLRRKEQ